MLIKSILFKTKECNSISKKISKKIKKVLIILSVFTGGCVLVGFLKSFINKNSCDDIIDELESEIYKDNIEIDDFDDYE